MNDLWSHYIRITRIPFALDENTGTLKPQMELWQNVIQPIKEQYRDEFTSTLIHDMIDDFQQRIQKVELYPSDVKDQAQSERLEKLNNEKERFRRRLVEYDGYYNHSITQRDVQFLNDVSQNRRKKVSVLNRDNPFADVRIQNDAFLYPTQDGTYASLRLQVGRNLTYNEEQQTLQLDPNVSVIKSKSTKPQTTAYWADDTVSTKQDDIQSEEDVIYI